MQLENSVFEQVPSRFKPSQEVTLDFGGQRITGCFINASKFTEQGKILYDIRIPIQSIGEKDYTFIDNVDSTFVTPA